MDYKEIDDEFDKIFPDNLQFGYLDIPDIKNFFHHALRKQAEAIINEIPDLANETYLGDNVNLKQKLKEHHADRQSR